MGCLPVSALSKPCSDGNLGGAAKLYLIRYADLKQNAYGTEVFTGSTAGVITGITLASSATTFVEVAVLKDTAGIVDNAVIDQSKGVYYFEQELKFNIQGINSANWVFVNNIINQPVVALVKSKMGTWIGTGFNGLLFANSIQGGLGQVSSDSVGYQLSFKGDSTTPLYLVSDSVAKSVIS